MTVKVLFRKRDSSHESLMSHYTEWLYISSLTSDGPQWLCTRVSVCVCVLMDTHCESSEEMKSMLKHKTICPCDEQWITHWCLVHSWWWFIAARGRRRGGGGYMYIMYILFYCWTLCCYRWTLDQSQCCQMINRIQNKSFVIIIYVCTMYIFMYINSHTRMCIYLRKPVMFIY